jgi:hypothetical protein
VIDMADPVAVLTTAWTLGCSLQGSVAVGEQTPVKLRVAGSPVLLEGTVQSWTVADCKAVTPPPPSTKSPCSKVGKPTAGATAKLSVGGHAVLLSSFNAPAVGSAVAHTVSVTGPTPPPRAPLKVSP